MPAAPEVRAAPPIGAMPQDVLLARLRSADEREARDALHILYVTLFERLWRFAYLTVREREAAEEVTQDVFWGVWQRRATLAVSGDIAVYLHTAVRYRAMKYARHARVVARHAEAVGDGRSGAFAEQAVETPDDVFAATELERAFLDALAHVPDRPRQALVLRWRDGWTYEEIGTALGISKVAARGLVLRYQRQLQPFLERLRAELSG
jgi:RNA polymerase sigma-70 factor (ECF subfamily)